MSQQLYVTEQGQKRARQVTAPVGVLRPRESQAILEPSNNAASPESEEFRNAVNGCIVGAIIGLAYGAATLMVIGSTFIPGVLGACLILGYSALGGVIFGSLIGSTGLFARRPR